MYMVHYSTDYMTFTILVRETWNDNPIFALEGPASLSRGSPCLNFFAVFEGGFYRSVLRIFHLLTSNYNPNNKTNLWETRTAAFRLGI